MNITIRLTDEEAGTLSQYAGVTGISRQHVCRCAIRDYLGLSAPSAPRLSERARLAAVRRYQERHRPAGRGEEGGK